MELVRYHNEVIKAEDLEKRLRADGVDANNELSADYIIGEAYEIGEWEELHPRLSEDGVGMSQGWHMQGKYFPTANGATKLVREWGFASLDLYFASEDADNEECYWTQWDIESEEDELWDTEGIPFVWDEAKKWWIKK